MEDYFREILPLIDEEQQRSREKSFEYVWLPEVSHERGLRYDPEEDGYCG